MKHIGILGATGSIGTQALDVISENTDKFRVRLLTAGKNHNLLIEQARKFKPDYVVIADESRYKQVKHELNGISEVHAGSKAIEDLSAVDEIDILLTAMVGYSGLLPSIKAIEAKKDIALANKETLVVAGDIISKLAQENKVKILPVDSEHSAIFQSLVGEKQSEIEKIYLTASGGPFRGKNLEFLKNVTKKQALKHPNWDMGAKITIDSASLMNKGLEVIEAKWLFNLKPEQINVIVHPQSIIHSIVQFIDGSMKAQMGLPDMKLPIQYALAYPERIHSEFERFSFLNYPELTFEKPDTTIFRNLELAYYSMKKGGNMACIMNAANEIAVNAFLNDKAGFLQMTEIIENVMQKATFIQEPNLIDYIESDKNARLIAEKYINKLN